MVDYLTLIDLLAIAKQVLGHDPEVRDWGLLDSAVLRPQTTVFGQDAYASFHDKAAALMQSLATNHALIDGNKRLAWVATRLFYVLNEGELQAPNPDAGEAFVTEVATGKLELTGISAVLAGWCKEPVRISFPAQRGNGAE